MWYRLLLCFCVVSAVCAGGLYVRKAPQWSFEIPQDSSCIYGVGVATLHGDVALARKRAEKDALLKISQTLKSVVVGSVKSRQKALVIGGEPVDLTQYDEAIEVFTQSTLTDCRIVSSVIVKKDKTCWVLASLNKSAYDKKINAHFYNAVDIAASALEATYTYSEQEEISFVSLVNRLVQGLDAVEEFWGVPMRASVNGKEVVLNVAIPERFEELFSELSLSANSQGPLLLTSTEALSGDIGVFVRWRGIPVKDISLIWNAGRSVKIVEKQNRNGFVPLVFSELPAGGPVSVEAFPDVNSFLWMLKKRGVTVGGIPSVTLRVQAVPKKVHVVFGAHTREFVNWLTASGEAVLSQEGLGLELQIEQTPARLKRGLFHVSAAGELKLQGVNGSRIERVSVTGMGRSETEAFLRSKDMLYKKLTSLL